MQENEFFPLIRQRQFTELDFVSYFGGTLGMYIFSSCINISCNSVQGLFAGISFLTCFELIYYFLLRPLMDIFTKTNTRIFPDNTQENEENDTSEGNDLRQKEIPEMFTKSVRYFYHYMEESSLHGLNHATSKNFQAIGKFFWLTSFITSMILCGISLKDIYEKFIVSPIIVSFDGDLQNVNDVNFLKKFFQIPSDVSNRYYFKFYVL